MKNYSKRKDKNLRICMIIPSFYPLVGGAEQQLNQLSQKLANKGIEVFIVTRRISKTKKVEMFGKVPVYRIFYKWHTISFLFSLLFFLISKKDEYDILHVHTMHSPAIIACLAKIILKKKLVVKVRRIGRGSLLENISHSKVKSLRMRFLIRGVNCFVTVNRAGGNLLEKIGVQQKAIHWISNGVDIDQFNLPIKDEKDRLKELLQLTKRPVILFIGRLIPRKKVHLIIKILPILKKYFTNINLLIVGKGQEEENLRKISEKLGVLENVTFAGQCSKEKILEYLKVSDVFVLPSESEGVSNALLEAMSVGLPSIVSNIDGMEDLLTDESSGYILHSISESLLLEKILLLLKDAKLRARIGQNARKEVKKKFSFDIITEQYINLYKELVAGGTQSDVCSYIQKWHKENDKKYLQSYYNRPEYKKIYDKPKRKWIKKFEILIKMMELQPGMQVLDVGCAAKMLKPLIEKKGATYKGMDIADSFKPDYVCDAENMDIIPDNSFDWIVLSDILEHLPYPEKALGESCRISKRVVAVLPNWYRLERFNFLPRDPNDRHLTKMAPKEWIKTFQQAGFRITKLKGYYYVPSIAFYPLKILKLIDLAFRTKPFEYIGSIFDRFFSEKKLFRFMGQELVIIAEKNKNRGV